MLYNSVRTFKNETQTAVINMVNQRVLIINFDVWYTKQRNTDIFSKVTVTVFGSVAGIAMNST